MNNNQLKSIIDRIERLEFEKAGIASDVKDIYLEAKSNGYDPKIIRKVIALRESAIDLLHEQQVGLLKDWRKHVAAGDRKEADALLPQMLLSLNAIAAGLQATG